MAISAQMVKELRDKTGIGMMDCKRALGETGGDFDKAAEWLRKKGIATAEKRADRPTKEGVIFAYVHPGDKLGVLVEVNCETDFVARTDDFKHFAKDAAMQIAAMSPIVVRREEVPEEALEREKEIYRTQAANEGKPEKVLDRIVAGRLEKFYQEACLMEQPFVKDAEKTMQDILTELIARTGENITVRRFIRFRLGGDEA